MSGDLERASSRAMANAARSCVAQTTQSFCKLKISIPPGSSITDEGPREPIILQIFLQNMLFSPKSLPSSLLFC